MAAVPSLVPGQSLRRSGWTAMVVASAAMTSRKFLSKACVDRPLFPGLVLERAEEETEQGFESWGEAVIEGRPGQLVAGVPEVGAEHLCPRDAVPDGQGEQDHGEQGANVGLALALNDAELPGLVEEEVHRELGVQEVGQRGSFRRGHESSGGLERVATPSSPTSWTPSTRLPSAHVTGATCLSSP